MVGTVIRFLLYGWIAVGRTLLEFWKLERRARRLLRSECPKKRGMGRSTVRFMCEHFFWQTSVLHRRGGWLATRHLELVDYAATVALKKGDGGKPTVQDWKANCYATLGFVIDGRGFKMPEMKSSSSPPIVLNKPIEL